MNYIKKLQAENAELKAQLKSIRSIQIDLENYLLSPKFQGLENHWVNPDDVLHRLEPVKYYTLFQA